MAKGYFISIEGVDGAGKTTQVQLLKAKLIAANYQVLATREPGGNPTAESIRELILNGATTARFDPKTEALLHMAARVEHVEGMIKPALQQGFVVICDRFMDSTLAYQGYGLGVDLKELQALYHFACGTLRPNLTLILDVPLEISIKRIEERKGQLDHYEQAGVAFLDKLRKGFREIAALNPKHCHLIDANQPAPAIHQNIWELVVKQLLNLSKHPVGR
jgi:dTMP kinase